MSHRYVSGVLRNDWNDPVDFRSLDRSQRGCHIWVIKRSILSFPVYITKKNVKSVIDSAVLHWTTQLMVFPRNAIFGPCYLVSTRHEILSNIDRNLTGTRLRLRKKLNTNKSRESTNPIPALLLSLESQTLTVVFQLFDFHLWKFKKFIMKKGYTSTVTCLHWCQI